MTRQEFKEFLHEEFISRGFEKKKNMYYLKGNGLLCGLYIQKSISDAYYVEYDFFLGDFENVKKYPTTYDADVSMRFSVLSKDMYDGEYFMDACIDYALYTEQEIKKYFDKEFEEIVMPIVEKGKEGIKEHLEYFFDEMFEEEKPILMEKLKD